MVVNLPGGRRIIIDAKVPYVAYRQAVEATGDDERRARLKEHAGQVKAHMVELGSRGYWAQFQPAPEFVFMFMPGEGYFSAALQHGRGADRVRGHPTGDSCQPVNPYRIAPRSGVWLAAGADSPATPRR